MQFLLNQRVKTFNKRVKIFALFVEQTIENSKIKI